MENLTFDSVEPQFITVTIAGEQYRLYELTKAAAMERDKIKLRAASMVDGRFVVDPTATVVIEPTVVAKCLFKVVDGVDQEISLEQVMKMKDEVVEKMFDAVKEMTPSMRVEKEPNEEDVKRGIALMKEIAKN